MLWPAAGANVFESGRLDLPEPLTDVAPYYWWVTWRHDRPAPVRQQVLTHPMSHLTIESADGGRLHGLDVPAALVHGVVTKVFTVQLPVAGRVAGVAFHPGGLTALVGQIAGDLTNAVVSAEQLFAGTSELTEQVLSADDDEARREAIAAFLQARLEPDLDRVRADRAYRTVRRAVDLMRSREQVALAPIAEQVHVSVRTLQRLFARYVGVSPLWVLRRHRLQDAVAALDAGDGGDIAALAASLGFADHAHFTRAFTQLIGVTPSAYRAGVR